MRDMHACRREPLICISAWMITRAMEVRAIDDHLVASSVILTAASSSDHQLILQQELQLLHHQDLQLLLRQEL